MELPSRILVPVDFSDESIDAVQYAQKLAVALGAELHLLYIIDDPFLSARTTDESYRDTTAHDVTDALRQLIPDDVRDQVNAQFQAATGSPPALICSYAMAHSIDAIIMSTHGRGAIAKALMGSVADKVIRLAPCPVTTIRGDVEEAAT